jgi:hypothetical protein
MWRHRIAVTIVGVGVSFFAPLMAHSQRDGSMRGMGPGMMGAAHDSATRALAAGSHQLVMSHRRIERTVANLPNGVRTVTESDDPQVAALIRDHVAITVKRVEARDDPGLPMESPALRTLFRNGDRIRTTTTPTPRGVTVVQTSDDPATIAALQQHAAEVSELVEGGMAALHAAMMKNGGMGTGMGMGMGMGGRRMRGAATGDTITP